MDVLRVATVDVAGKVEVVVVLFGSDLFPGNHARIARHILHGREDRDDAVDVALAQAVLVAVFGKPL